MTIEKIGTRNIVFRYHEAEWDLNLHLIIGEQYNYLIDTGLGLHSVMPIKKYLEGNKNPIIVINTHFHWDHIWGNHCFEDSIIIAHELCKELIVKHWDEMLEKNQSYIRGKVEKKLPNLLIKDSLYFVDDGIYIFYAPGHTMDGICVFDEKDKVLNVGDNIGDSLDELLPDLDMDMQSYLKSIMYYQEFDFQTCISGHNQTLDKGIFKDIEELIKAQLNSK